MVKNEGKIITIEGLKKLQPHLQGKKTVLVGGCFDLLHYGHFQFLKKAKKTGDYLIIALESDQFIKNKKRKLPIHNQRQRAKILAVLNIVDLVVLLPLLSSDKDYFNFVKQIKPSIIAVTKGDPQLINKQKQAKTVGGILKVVMPLIKRFSTQKYYATIFSH